MFGLSLGEIMVLLIVGIVVIGPRNLPSMMRTMGQWVAKIRRMSTDLRSQSGIDDLIRQEGLEREISELRSLSRMSVVDTLITPALAATSPQPRPYTPAVARAALPEAPEWQRIEPLREREYPLIGCDAHDAVADDAVPYPPPEHRPPLSEIAGEAAPAAVARDEAASDSPSQPDVSEPRDIAPDARGAEGAAS